MDPGHVFPQSCSMDPRDGRPREVCHRVNRGSQLEVPSPPRHLPLPSRSEHTQHAHYLRSRKTAWKEFGAEIKQAILQSVRENEDIADQRLDEQFKTLFVAPLGEIKNQTHPILIVVDALDEWDDSKDAVAFVRLIDRHSSLFPVNVKFLLTCRPEAALVRALEPREWHTEDLDSVTGITHDLRRFFQHAFTQIKDDHDLQDDWPSSGDLEHLLEMSQGLFQWAHTAISYIGDRSPPSRLRGLLQRPAAWRELDDLYHQILSKAFDEIKLDPMRTELLSWILGSLVVAPNPISLEIIATLYRDHAIFNGMGQEDIIQSLHGDILADLNSLLRIPTSAAELMRLMHTSVHDLLVNQQRCERRTYFINRIQSHDRLASVCLALMQRDLRQNICDISDPSTANSDIQDVVERNVSNAIQYCCRSWPIHLTEGSLGSNSDARTSQIQLAALQSFSTEKLLFWIEVMSLVGATAEAILMARNVHQWLLQCSSGISDSTLTTLWNDAQRFIAAFLEPIMFGALQIYCSALPHCPVGTKLFELYGNLSTIRLLHGPQPAIWSSNLWTRSIGSGVLAVAFSPTGQIMATVSNNSGVQLWAAQTGAPLLGAPLHQPSRSLSVAFSPDGKILATGSFDGMVWLWDPKTGVSLREPLSGHGRPITSLAFSPNGELLASGSNGNEIWLWDAHLGISLGEPSLGHRGPVQSLAFSPDGKTLASSSNDQTIQIWNASTGAQMLEPLVGHSAIIRSVAFSPDGTLLVSGSDDSTIRRWDPRTGTALGEPLTGRRGWVSSIAFSPDGTILASGCSHDTIQLWNARTWTLIGKPLTAHNGWVRSVSFSPDGKFLASGAFDNTLRLWDIQTARH